MRGSTSLENVGYRRGVVLGLTIAEIILLILFAVVLAMTGVLIKRKNATIAEVETRMAAQQLPTNISRKLSEMQINLSTRSGEQQLMGILNSADMDPDRVKRQQQALQLGLDIQKAFGNNITADQLIKNQNELESLKNNLSKSDNGKIQGPCYQVNANDPVPFVFDIFVRNDVLVMRDVVPERLRNKFESDFKGTPSSQTFTNERDFTNKTRSFAEYGKRHQCKFYVKVYDETTGNSKQRIKSQLKIIETAFVWTFMMAGKSGDKEDINLFPVAPTQLK